MDDQERVVEVGRVIEDLLNKEIMPQEWQWVLLEISGLVEEGKYPEAKVVLEKALQEKAFAEMGAFRIRAVALLNHLIILEVGVWTNKVRMSDFIL